MDTENGEHPAFDSQLLNQMAEVHANSACAEEAWEEFYRRHYDYLFHACRNAYSKQIGEGPVSEVVQDCFVKAFQKASTFRSCPGQSAEEDRLHVRAWLGSILQNAVRDLYRHEPQVIFTYDIEFLPDQDHGKSDPGDESTVGPLEKAFMELEEREQEVLRETMLWHNPGARQQRMPSHALAALAAALKTTPANIRQIRSRAIEKLKHATGEKS